MTSDIHKNPDEKQTLTECAALLKAVLTHLSIREKPDGSIVLYGEIPARLKVRIEEFLDATS